MKIIFSILIMLIASFISHGQKVQNISYVTTDTSEKLDNDPIKHVRTYLNDTIFIEDAVFAVRQSPYDVLKKVASGWYLYDLAEERWSCIYCMDSPKNVTIDRGFSRPNGIKLRYRLHWIRQMCPCMQELWLFYFEPIGFSQSHLGNYYYFSPESGIIGWRLQSATKEAVFIRKEISENCSSCFIYE